MILIFLLADTSVQLAMKQLGLTADASMLPEEVVHGLLKERLTIIKQTYTEDIHELLLERADLFDKHFPNPKDITIAVQVSELVQSINMPSI